MLAGIASNEKNAPDFRACVVTAKWRADSAVNACLSANACIFPALTRRDTAQNCRHSAAALTRAIWQSEPLTSFFRRAFLVNMGLSGSRNCNKNNEKQNSNCVRLFHVEWIWRFLVSCGVKSRMLDVQLASVSSFVPKNVDQNNAHSCVLLLRQKCSSTNSSECKEQLYASILSRLSQALPKLFKLYSIFRIVAIDPIRRNWQWPTFSKTLVRIELYQIGVHRF